MGNEPADMIGHHWWFIVPNPTRFSAAAPPPSLNYSESSASLCASALLATGSLGQSSVWLEVLNVGEIHEPVCIWLFVSSLPGPVLTFALYYVHVNKTDKKRWSCAASKEETERSQDRLKGTSVAFACVAQLMVLIFAKPYGRSKYAPMTGGVVLCSH